jgi:hypothetical protein
MRRVRLLLLALAATVAGAAPAAAAVTPTDLGPGSKPSVVVDPAGTAHILFLAGLVGTPQYCRLPRGATACDVRATLGDSDDIEQVQILRRESDGVLIAVGRASNRLWIAFSSDGGASFVPAGWNAAEVGLAETFTLAPGGQSVFAWHAGRPGQTGILLADAAFGAPDLRYTVLQDGSSPAAGAARVATLPDGRIVAGTTWSGGLTWNLFAGGDALDPSRWIKRGHLKEFSPAIDFAAGPRGLFMIERTTTRIRKALVDTPPLYLRTFDLKRNRWSRASGILADRGGPFDKIRAAQDASGRLHVLTSVTNDLCLMYSRTGPKRRSGFGRTNVLVRRALRPAEPEFAVAPDGGGTAVWQEYDRTTDQTRVWAAPLQAAKGKYRRVAPARWKGCR